MTATTEVALITATTTIVPAEAFRPGGLDDVLAKIKAEVTAIDTDVSTAAGRKNIASIAYKVARSKTALDEVGKTLAADLKKQTSAIDAERKKAREFLDSLKDEVRRPLDEYEAREKARVEGLEARVDAIGCMDHFDGEPTTADIEARLKDAQAVDLEDLAEFRQRGEQAKATVVTALEGMLERSRQRDAERAELERLRREAEERAAREAQEKAEREQQEREERAAAQARAEADKAAQEERDRHEREMAEAAERADRAEREHAEALARAEADRIAAVEAAKREAEEEAQRERDRLAAQQRAEEAEAARRAADKAHRAEVNGRALTALVTAGVDEDVARTVVTLIAKGHVPGVSITY